jgi:8-oxo-dGTP diphosphatase
MFISSWAERRWRNPQSWSPQDETASFSFSADGISDGCSRGGRKRARETEKECLRREIREELPNLKLGALKLLKEVKGKNRRSGRKMNDAIFIAKKASGALRIGDKREIDRAVWRKPRGLRLTPTSRYIRDKLFPK